MKILTLQIPGTLLIAGLALALSLSCLAQEPVFNQYHTPSEISRYVNAFAKTQPALVKVHSLGKGYKGTDYQIIEIGKETKSNTRNNPAVLVVANLEGTTPLASEGALFLIRELLKKPDQLENLTWFVLACGNPDGADRFFQRPLIMDGRNLRPWNDDMDEQTDEDGPEDLNGDGYITQMRVQDPEGTYIPDDKDPRMMKRADPSKGEKGIYKLYPEGIDNDGDGQYNEDSPGGTNIGITFPPGTTVDDAMVARMLEMGAVTNPFDADMLPLPQQIDSLLNVQVPWIFELVRQIPELVTDDIMGAFTLVGELFQSNTETYRSDTTKPAAIDERSTERIKFNDYLTNGAMYSNWKPYKHPLYGNIEIGGWSKFNSRLPQPFMLMDLVHRNAMAVFVSAFNLPQISMEVFEKEKIGKDLYRIKVRLTNSKAVSSITYQSVRLKINPMDYLKLDGKNIRVVAGGPLTDLYRNEASYKQYKPEIQFFQIPSFGRLEFQFLVSGKGKLKLEYHSEKATDRTKEIEL